MIKLVQPGYSELSGCLTVGKKIFLNIVLSLKLRLRDLLPIDITKVDSKCLVLVKVHEQG